MKHYAPHGLPFCPAKPWPSRSVASVAETTCKSCIRAINSEEGLNRLLTAAQRQRAGRHGKPLPSFVRVPELEASNASAAQRPPDSSVAETPEEEH